MFEKSTRTMILEAVSPIAHHAESFGNTAIIMTEPVLRADGSRVKVPIITGDTMRHGLREAAAYAFLDAAELLEEPSLSEAALRLLFSGGQIGGPSGSSISIRDYRAMVELVPSLGLLGGCAGNRMLQGRVWVDRALLICAESWPIIERDEWSRAWVTEHMPTMASARSSRDLVQRVRMDPTLTAAGKALLSPAAALATSERMLASEAASEAGDALAILDSKSSMMPRTFEVVATGARFVWSVTATLLSELDRDTFLLMLAAWLSNMVVGGKKGTGHGRLVAIDGWNLPHVRVGVPDERGLPTKDNVGARFREHVSERAAAIKDFLAKVEA
jgi:CRISPR type IV-associated protein Csf2